MIKLSETRKAYEDASGKLSDINRQLCFAGFAIIWLYNMSDGEIKIPKELYFPGVLLIASLVIDVLQYVYTTVSWHLYYENHTSSDKKEEEENISEPKYINTPAWILFWLKIVGMLWGYILIGKFLILKLL